VGCGVNRKRVQRLMRHLGRAGRAPGPQTRRPHPGHKVYPYRLRGLSSERPNQVWSTDITYIRLARGFAYLVAILDGYSRKVLAWDLSNSLEAGFCVDCLEEALRRWDRPSIFNTDQAPAKRSRGSWRAPAWPSAGTGGGGPWTRSSWNGYGAASSTKLCI